MSGRKWPLDIGGYTPWAYLSAVAMDEQAHPLALAFAAEFVRVACGESHETVWRNVEYGIAAGAQSRAHTAKVTALTAAARAGWVADWEGIERKLTNGAIVIRVGVGSLSPLVRVTAGYGDEAEVTPDEMEEIAAQLVAAAGLFR